MPFWTVCSRSSTWSARGRTLPILSNVLIQAKDGKLRLTTTDLDVGVSGTVEADIKKEGAATLPVKRLVNIIRELPCGRRGDCH